jgi:hypothetical protein
MRRGIARQLCCVLRLHCSVAAIQRLIFSRRADGTAGRRWAKWSSWCLQQHDTLSSGTTLADVVKLSRRNLLYLAVGAAVLPTLSRVASAETYPSRPVHWIVSFAAGGPNDIVARIVGQYLSDHLGQQFVIENRTGAGGNVGMQSALSSAPDGYTIAFVGPNYAINPALYEKLPFDFIRDSVPVAGIMRLANVMEVNPALPANNVAEFIDRPPLSGPGGMLV